MKKISLLSILLVMFSALSITSCDTEPVDPVLNDNINNPDNPNNPNPEDGVFKVDFNGSTYVATSTIAVVGDGLISIGGMKGTNGEQISVIVQGTAEGTYASDKVILDYNPGDSEYSYTNFNITTGDESGTVTITEIDTANKTISGTFSFEGWWGDNNSLPSIQFSNGTFENIPYTDGIETNEYFRAKVDGVSNEYADDDLIIGVGGTSINMIGYGANHSITVLTKVDVVPGTYSFTETPFDEASAEYTDENDVEYEITSGTLTIISNEDGWLKGTFTYIVKNDAGETIHTVTNGEFNVEYDF